MVAQLSNAKFAAKYRFDTERIFLIGHSLGAWNALMTTAHAPSVRATAALATFNVGYFAERLHHEAGFKDELIKALEVLGTDPLHNTSPRQLADEIEAHYEIWDPRSFTAQLTTRPLYLVGAKHDIEAPKEPHHDAIVTWIKAAGHDHITDEVLDTDHGFGDMREALIAKLIAWLDGVE